METIFLSTLTSNSDPAHPISAAVYTPDHPSFTTVLTAYIHNLRFSTPSTPKPFLIITALHLSHVRAAVISAATTGVQMKIRSGGHDYEGRSYASSSAAVPFLILDMCNLRAIDIDIQSETAWVQTGATLGELFHRIADESPIHAFPGGVCPTVGVGGHFVGGGYGNLMRKYGLSVDNIVDAVVVNAKGDVVDRKSMGEDLFWAIRGGGASFGVVVAYKVNLVKVPEVVTVFRVERTLEENATDIVYAWQHVAPTADVDLFIRLVLDVVTTNKKTGEKTIRASFIGMFLGNRDRLLSITRQTFPELGLVESDCIESSWINTIPFWADMPNETKSDVLLSRQPQKLVRLKRKSDYVQNPISKSALELIWQKMKELELVKMGFNPYGGKMSQIPSEATPFPHRAGNLWKIQYQLNWMEEGEESERRHLKLCRELYNYMTPYVSSSPRCAFLNYKDLDLGINGHDESSYEESKRYGLSYFKGNFEKLVRIKSRVDPGNLFRHEQSVPNFPRAKL
ncbi:Berberine bridge enzyme-like 8 [Linum perenne]